MKIEMKKVIEITERYAHDYRNMKINEFELRIMLNNLVIEIMSEELKTNDKTN